MNLFAGIFSPIESVLEDVLVWLHSNGGLTWAWSIIALTAIVRLAIFPITAKQTRSSLAMQRLQPYLKQLQAKHKDDRQALNAAMMEFYRDNKVNPLASCLPLLIQIPVFLSLFFVLKDFSAPSGTSSDFSWLFGFVDDIRQHIDNGMGLKDMRKAAPDIDRNWGAAGWILLVVYIGSQMLSTVTMMTSPNPQQKWIFLLLPLFFAPFILNFPVGVMLYWITTNLWSLFQYLLVVRFTDTSKEVVLPADSKGRKKVVGPSTSKSGSKAPAGSSAAAGPHAAPRRNKRRK
ncbi:MAG: YidC/Oxa1 family rane protein insertase [Thermoleophilia bacterium]|nr:YidC/Oxa1 family rane protein insertase [Thermoleophilia bacterium]